MANYFNTSRTIVLSLVLVIIILVTGFGTTIYHMRKTFAGEKHTVATDPRDREANCSNSVAFLSRELDLTAEQKEKVTEIKSSCMHESRCMVSELRSNKELLLKELAGENPDPKTMDSLSALIGKQQEKILNTTVSQYLQIKQICTAEQKVKLSSLYFELMGCGQERGEKAHVNRMGGSGEHRCDTGCRKIRE